MFITLHGRLDWGLQSLLRLAAALVGVGWRRLWCGPLRPGWSLRLEVATCYWRRQTEHALSLPDSSQARGYLDALWFHDPVMRRIEVRDAPGAPVPARWMSCEPTRGVMLFLHGGGFELFPRSLEVLMGRVAEAVRTRMLTPHYRLAPEHPFPAALNDALATYCWLLDRGVQPEELIVAGDSAGGGLALCLLDELTRHELPRPAAVLALSPWTDLTNPGASYTPHHETDFVCRMMSERWARMYAAGADVQDPRISAVHAEFRNWPPVYLQAGGAEVLIDMIREFTTRAQRAGAPLRLDVWQHMNHEFQAYAEHQPESREALQRMSEFVQEALQGTATDWLGRPAVVRPGEGPRPTDPPRDFGVSAAAAGSPAASRPSEPPLADPPQAGAVRSSS